MELQKEKVNVFRESRVALSEGKWAGIQFKKLSPEMGCSMALNVPLTENLFKLSSWNKADKPTLEKPLICSTMSLLVI